MAERDDTTRLSGFIRGVSWPDLPGTVQHAARRHLIDTVGVIIRGAETDLARRVGALLLAESQGRVPLPGTDHSASRFDAAYVAGVGGHGLELDDGYRAGSVHPGVAVVPALMAASHGAGVDGVRFMSALVAGYECVAAVSRAVHPNLRRRGFHPTGTVGALGAAAAVGRLQGLDADAIGRALGIAASAASGLFAFVGGGGDVKRLHAGHAAREGLVAALLAEIGTGGPPAILEGRDGFNQAFAGEAPPLVLPPEHAFGLEDCYIKPYPCCRHLQPALEALIELRKAHGLSPGDVRAIRVETYGIAAEHAHTGWADFATAQLSFPYIMALGLHFGDVTLEHFAPECLANPDIAATAAKLGVVATAEMDGLYPGQRPARVTVETTAGGQHALFMPEAPGSSIMPITDAAVERKFSNLVTPVLGAGRTAELLDALWHLDRSENLDHMIALCARPKDRSKE